MRTATCAVCRGVLAWWVTMDRGGHWEHVAPGVDADHEPEAEA